MTVISTTRNPDKEQSLIANGSDHVIIDSGTIKQDVHDVFPKGVDKILELIGTEH